MKFFDDTDYIIEKYKNIRYQNKQKRSLCIDIDKALNAGLDLEGFGLDVGKPLEESIM